MGSVNHFNVHKIIKQYGARIFFETGTGMGSGLQFAAQFPFYQLYSTEIEEELFGICRVKFAQDKRINLLLSPSEPALDIVLQLLPIETPIMFWLDAHFPGADFGLARRDDEHDETIRLPLERELETICRHRPLGKDVILIDDLRIYEDGPFTDGNILPEHHVLPPAERNIDFIFKLLGKTHEVSRDFQDQGYVIAVPKA